MRSILAAASLADLEAALDRAEALAGVSALSSLRAALTPRAFAAVKGVAGAVDHAAGDGEAPTAVLARLSDSFDRVAGVSPEAGAALYSLGDSARLAEATAEVVGWLRREGLFRPGERVLEVGCGAGRFLAALGAEAGLMLGLELSPAMAAEAARRTAALPGVGVAQGTGRDLACIADAAVDLVLFADSFPYLVLAGGDLPRAHLADAARALRPGGRAVILNYSYRDDPARDLQELAALAAAAGLTPTLLGAQPFAGWDGRAYVVETV